MYLDKIQKSEFKYIAEKVQKKYPIDISVSLLNNKCEIIDMVKDYLQKDYDWTSTAFRKQAYDMLVIQDKQNVSGSEYNYKYNDICQIILQFFNSIKNDRIHSFIYFLNYKLNIIHLDFIKEFLGKYKFRKTYYINVLDKNYFDVDYNLLNSETFQEYEKIFLITTYQTAGVGVNLQYLYDGNYKEFDACYLSKVSNVLPQPSKKNKSNNSKSLYGIMYLKANDSLSKAESDSNIKNILVSNNISIGKYSKHKDICLGETSILIQAVGRICRNPNRKEYSYIGIDSNNMTHLSSIKSYIESNVHSREFSKLLDNVKNDKKEDLEHITNANKYTYNTIKEVLKRPMTVDAIIRWKLIRRIALTYPTINDINLLKENKGFYFKNKEKIKQYSVDKYNFTTDLSYECKNFSENCNNVSSNRLSISQGSANLSAIAEIEEVKEHFIKNNYKLQFEKNNYIMSSEFFKSIYKGALGEEFGKIILKKFNIELFEVNDPEIFEFFDYKNGDYYFDFKFWHSSMTKVEYIMLKKISRKAKLVGAKKVYIINVFYEGYEDTPKEGYIYKVDDIDICTISWLYNKITKRFNDIALIALHSEILECKI